MHLAIRAQYAKSKFLHIFARIGNFKHKYCQSNFFLLIGDFKISTCKNFRKFHAEMSFRLIDMFFFNYVTVFFSFWRHLWYYTCVSSGSPIPYHTSKEVPDVAVGIIFTNCFVFFFFTAYSDLFAIILLIVLYV